MIIFIDTKYSNHMVASRPIKDYSAENLLSYTHDTSFSIFINSNLIGLTLKILNLFINSPYSVCKVDNEFCIFKKSNRSLDIPTINSDEFQDLTQDKIFDISGYNICLLNDNKKIIEFTKKINSKLRDEAIANGVFLQDPETCYLSYDTKFGQDVFIEPNVFFGSSVIVGNGVRIKAFSYIENTVIGDSVSIGPFTHIRGKTEIDAQTKIGNFVEIKNSKIGRGVKASHLSYIGDSRIGANTNIGAGVVTCNYDGIKKHNTIIGEKSFIGSNVSLIAPINIGNNVLLGAGSVISQDVPDDNFSISRPKQEIKPNNRG